MALETFLSLVFVMLRIKSANIKTKIIQNFYFIETGTQELRMLKTAKKPAVVVGQELVMV